MTKPIVDARGNLHSTTNGHFSEKGQTDAEVSLALAGVTAVSIVTAADQERAAWLVQDRIDSIPQYALELDFTNAEDTLTAEEANLVLAGTPWEASAAVRDRLEDRRLRAAERHARNAAGDVGVDFDQLHPDDRDLIIDRVESRHLWDPIVAMTKHSPDKTFRAPISDPLLLEADGHDDIESDTAARQEVLLGILGRAGADRDDTAVRNAAAALAGAPISWGRATQVEIIWEGAVDDARLLPSTLERRIAFVGAHVAVTDTDTGQTSVVQVPRLNVTLDDERPAKVDDGAWTATRGELPESFRPKLIEAEPTVPLILGR
ncbi:hypothetical protein ACFVAJ_16905 [Agromyces sp. NPDC057679]|uniref:hypothetical protein n=1 Tax=Agromyces sp. NPDC057679 TaxID=3346207 RepID=UPI0036721FB9